MENGQRQSNTRRQRPLPVEKRALPLLDNLRRSLCSHDESITAGHDADATAKLRQTFARSSYSVRNVECTVDSSTVHLRGLVNSYRALQVAICLAKSVAAGRRIALSVDVVPAFVEAPV